VDPIPHSALEEFPRILRSLASAVSDGDARRRLEEEPFTFVQHTWHLADLEREGFGVRIGRIATEIQPFLPDFDGARIARERGYQALDPKLGAELFAHARAANLARLSLLDPEDLRRNGYQEGVGVVVLSEIPRRMLEHDLAHAAELETLFNGIGATHLLPPLRSFLGDGPRLRSTPALM
jgi:hypothetical protein